MELAIHEAPLDNSFQKQRRELASKGSLGRRRLPTRSNLRTFFDSLASSSDLTHANAENHSLNKSESLLNGDPEDGSIKSDSQSVPALGGPKDEGKGRKIARKGSVLIQTWERRSLGDKTPYVSKGSSSLSMRKKVPDPREACSARLTINKKTELRSFDTTEGTKNIALPGKRPSISKETPTNAAAFRAGVRERNNVNDMKGRRISPCDKKDEPEWISLSRKLCAKFVESHLDGRGEETDPSKHDIRTQPVVKTESTVRSNTKVYTNGHSEEPQWIHLSKKLCTKFLEQHIEYAQGAPENQHVIVPCAEASKQVPREVQITEKFPRGPSRDQGSRKEEPEWISLSKKLRAKFIEGHLDDPDKVSFESQLNASDLEENFSVPALAKRYLECRHQTAHPSLNSAGLQTNQAAERNLAHLRFQNGTRVYSSFSRSMLNLSTKEYGDDQTTPEDDRRTSFSEETEYISYHNHSPRDHIPPSVHPSSEDCEESIMQLNKGNCNELRHTENNCIHDDSWKMRDEYRDDICDIEENATRRRLAKVVSPRDSHQFSKGGEYNRTAVNAVSRFAEETTFDHEKDVDEPCLSVHFDEEFSYEDVGPISYPSEDCEGLIGTNLDSNENFHEVSSELKSITPQNSEKSENISGDSPALTITREVREEEEKLKKMKSFLSVKEEEDFCRIRFRIIPGKSAALSERERKSDDVNGMAFPEVHKSNHVTNNEDSSDKHLVVENTADVSNAYGKNGSKNLPSEDREISSRDIERNLRGEISRTIDVSDIKDSEDSLEMPKEFSTTVNYSSVDKCQIVHCDGFDDVNEIPKDEETLHNYNSTDEEAKLPKKFAHSRSRVLRNSKFEEIGDESDLGRNSQRKLHSKSEISQGVCVMKCGNKSRDEQISMSSNERNKSDDNLSERIDECDPSRAFIIQRAFVTEEESDCVRCCSETSCVKGDMNAEKVKSCLYDEICRFKASPESSRCNRQANFRNVPSNAPDKNDFKVEHLYMNYSTEYGRLCKNNTAFKEASSNTPESLNSSSRAKSVGCLVEHKDYEESERHDGSFSDPFLVRVVSAEVLNYDSSSYKESGEQVPSPSKAEISPSSTSSKPGCRANGARKSDDEFFKDSASTSVFPSDSESSSWTMTESNSYVINCSSSANESDLSDCSMSVRCGLESKIAKPHQRSPSISESGFYVSFKDSDNDDNFNKIGSYHSKAGRKEKATECQRNNCPSIPQSLRHLFDTPTSSMTAPNLHSSRLLMSKEPPSLFSTVSQMSRLPREGDGGETKKTKKTERSSSVKIRDIAQGIILTFRRLHSSSSKQSHLSRNHYVDVSHLAESNEKNTKDWLLGKSMVSQRYAQPPSNVGGRIRFDSVHPFFSGREYSTPHAKDMGTQSVRSWTKLKPGRDCNSQDHASHNGFKGKALEEEKRKKEGKSSDSKKKKRSKDRDRPTHGKTRLKRPESNSIPNISRKIQQMEDGTFYLVTTVSGDSSVPALYSESIEPGKEEFSERRRTATGESNC